jgi:hypothetical protein
MKEWSPCPGVIVSETTHTAKPGDKIVRKESGTKVVEEEITNKEEKKVNLTKRKQSDD